MSSYQVALDGTVVDALDSPGKLHELYWDDGLSLREIASQFNCHHTTVREYFEAYDIPRREGGGHPERTAYAALSQHPNGYEMWVDGHEAVLVHRLVMVAEHGFGALEGRHVHHQSRIPWDNRPENLELVTPRVHQRRRH